VVLFHSCDISIFTESWLHHNIPDSSVYIPGYHLVRSDRSNSKGGGIIVYIQTHIVHYDVLDYEIPNTESLFIKFNSLKIIFVCLYHPHWACPTKHTDAVDSLISIFSQLYHVHSNFSIVICGDFNGLSNHHQPICNSFNLFDIVPFSTRKNKKLDYFLTNIPLLQATKGAPIGKSDHCTIIIKQSNNKPQKQIKVIKKPDFSPGNLRTFSTLIKFLDSSFQSGDVDQNWNTFVQQFKEIFDFCFPLRTIRVYNNPKCPWITDNIRMLIGKRDNAYKRNNKSMYKHWKLKVRENLLKAKENYFRNIDKLQTRGQWKTVKDYLYLNKTNRVTISTDEELNNYFASVYINDDNHIATNTSNTNSDVITIEEAEVTDLINNLRKNGGYPFIYSNILRKFSTYLSKPLTALINKSLSSTIFPSILKQSTITPVPKISKPSCVSDFRPITAVSPFSKIIEKIVQTHWLEPIILQNQEKFLDQYAFVPLNGRGCQSALTFMYTKLALLADQKFFICTKHKVGNSSFINTTSGTPQGSLISPMLFAILLSTLSPICKTNCFFIKYADDLTMIIWHKEYFQLQLLCQRELDNVVNWCSQNQMKININKSKGLFHQSRQSKIPPKLYIEQEPLTFHQDAKVLGIYLSANLKWNKQVDYCINKASKNLFRLCILRRSCSHRTVICQIYEYFIRNILVYSFPAICNMPDYLIKKYVKFERRCCLLMGCSPSKTFIDIIYSMCIKFKYNILTLEDHPFRQMFLSTPVRTRNSRLIAPGGSTRIYSNSFIRFFYD